MTTNLTSVGEGGFGDHYHKIMQLQLLANHHVNTMTLTESAAKLINISH